ncbi:MAG: hypothetical protein ACLP36_02140 [Acidimicrobiales bacterium]
MSTPSRSPACALLHTVANPPPGIATTSSVLPLALAGLSLLEFDGAPAGEGDLAQLALVARIACFVVTVQEQHDLRPAGMTEDREQDLLALGCLATR